MRDEQRARILAAASAVFARKGPAATMDDIAAEAAISHGLAYRYFAGKEAIFRAIAEQAMRADPAPFQRALEATGTPGERLAALVSGLVESRRRPELHQLFVRMLDDAATPSDVRELARQRGRALHGALRRLIVEGQATGEVASGDPDQLVCAVLACLDGLVRWAIDRPERYTEHFPEASIFLRMLRPERGSGAAARRGGEDEVEELA